VLAAPRSRQSPDLRRRLRGGLFLLVPLLALAGALVLRAVDPPPIQDLRFWVFDHFQRLEPRIYRPGPVLVIDIDDETLRRFGQWPWPRTLLAQLVDRLGAAQPAAVALDILFPEPDRTSPARIIANWPELPELAELRERAARGDLPDHDQMLAEALRRSRAVAGFALTDTGVTGTAPVRLAGFATAGADPTEFLIAYDAVVPTLPEIAGAALGSGVINVQPERDGIIRRIPLLVAHGGEIYPSLAAEALRVAQNARTYVVKSTGASGVIGFGQRTGVSEVKIGQAVVPTDPKGRLWLYDTGPVPERVIPAWRVMSVEVVPWAHAGSSLLIGTSCAGR